MHEMRSGGPHQKSRPKFSTALQCVRKISTWPGLVSYFGITAVALENLENDESREEGFIRTKVKAAIFH